MAVALTTAPGSCYASVCSFGACGIGVGCCVAADSPSGSSYGLVLSLNRLHDPLTCCCCGGGADLLFGVDLLGVGLFFCASITVNQPLEPLFI